MRKYKYKFSKEWIKEQREKAAKSNPFDPYFMKYVDTIDGVGIYTTENPDQLHRSGCLISGIAKLPNGGVLICTDQVYEFAPENVKAFMRAHEVGHLVNGHLGKPVNKMSVLKRCLPISKEKNNEYEADLYAASVVGFRTAIYSLEWILHVVEYSSLPRREIRSRINRLLKESRRVR